MKTLLTAKQKAQCVTGMLVPSNLNTESFIGNYTSRNDERINLADGLNYFVSLILKISKTAQGSKQLMSTGYVNINRRVLLQSLASQKRISKVIDTLKKENIIICDDEFIPGKKSKGYWLTKKYTTLNLVPVQFKSKKNAERSVACERQIGNKKQKLLMDIYHLSQTLNDPDLQFNIEGLHHFVEIFRNRVMEGILNEPKFKTQEKKEQARHRLNLSIAQLKEEVREFGTKMYEPHRDLKGQRLHTPYTSIKKEARNFINYRNRQMASIDLKASQPYLLNVVLNPQFWAKDNEELLSLKLLWPELHSSLYRRCTPHTIMSSVSPETTAGKALQDSKYHSINWESDFYGYFMNGIKEQFQQDAQVLKCFETRGKTKHCIMLLFFDTKKRGQAKFRIPFQKMFPEVLHFMDKVRGIRLNGKNNILPLLLQRIEAALILEIITKEINKDHPHIPMLTIHDSILTDKAYRGIVKDYTERSLLKIIGRKPGLHDEILSKSALVKSMDDLIEKEMVKLTSPSRSKIKISDIFSEEYLEGVRVKSIRPLIRVMPVHGKNKVVGTRFLPGDKPRKHSRAVFSDECGDLQLSL